MKKLIKLSVFIFIISCKNNTPNKDQTCFPYQGCKKDCVDYLHERLPDRYGGGYAPVLDINDKPVKCVVD